MKKIILFLAVAAFVMTSCDYAPEPDPVTKSETPVLEFDVERDAQGVAKEIVIPEGTEQAILVHRYYDPYSGTLNLSVVTEDADGVAVTNPAIEGIDYNISTKALKINGEYNEETVVITARALDNKVTGDKKFFLKMESAANADINDELIPIVIKETEVASFMFQSDDIVNGVLNLKTGGDPVAVTLTREGADFAGTIDFEGETPNALKPAVLGVDYKVEPSQVTFAYGETSKVVTVTPLDPTGYHGRVEAALGFDMENADVEPLSIVIDTQNGVNDLIDYLTGTTFAFLSRSMATGGLALTSCTFTATTTDEVTTYQMQIGTNNAFEVKFNEDLQMSVDFPQYAGITLSGTSYVFLQWGPINLDASNNFVPDTAPQTLTMDYGYHETGITSSGAPINAWGFFFNIGFGLNGYLDEPDFSQGNYMGSYFTSSDDLGYAIDF